MKNNNHACYHATLTASPESASVAKALVDSQFSNSFDSKELSIAELNDYLQHHLSRPSLFEDKNSQLDSESNTGQ